jgi:S-adenosylmethionine hydrolase
MEGALALGRVAGFFPAGTAHIAVVDPGVGTRRRPVALRLGVDYYVGPDNGLFTVVLEQAEQKKKAVEIVHLNKSEYWLPEISNVFHGRDIFAPVGAHLARGVPLHEVVQSINDLERLSIPQPTVRIG